MAIRFKCAHCRRTVAVTRRAAGTQVPCPVCRQPLDVPTTTTAICLREPTAPPAAPILPETPAVPVVSPGRGSCAINYRIIGITSAAAIGCLALLTLAAATASRRPTYRSWEVAQASGRPRPEMVLAHLDKPLFEQPSGGMAESELQTEAAPPVDEMKYEPAAPLLISRRDSLDDEQLRKQLLKVPELGLYQNAYRVNTVSKNVVKMSFHEVNAQLRARQLHEIIDTVAKRPDLMGLPMIPAPDCQLGKEPAERLQAISTELRTKMASGIFSATGRRQRTTSDETQPVAEVLQEQRRYIKVGERMKEGGFRESSIPAVMQMLCVESRLVRQLVVEHLSQIDDKRSTQALAKLALFDLSARVRSDAVQVLAERSPSEYRQILLDGLRYPWAPYGENANRIAPVADHAAEALVALKDIDALPALRELAKLPDPSAPVYDPGQGKYFSRELVRINHLGNCMLCHAPSKAQTDLVRGRIPSPGEVLPPPVQYYNAPGDNFVRADITYLRQDFSVIQPVDDSGAWPSQQRFDYLVRNRPLNEEEARAQLRYLNGGYPQRRAVEFAIRELSSLPPKPQQNDELALEVARR